MMWSDRTAGGKARDHHGTQYSRFQGFHLSGSDSGVSSGVVRFMLVAEVV